MNLATTTSHSPSPTQPPARPRRTWLRRGAVVALIALALVVWVISQREPDWRQVIQQVQGPGVSVDLHIRRNPMLEKWGVPGWILDQSFMTRKTLTIRLTGDPVDDRWLREHQQALRSSCVIHISFRSDTVTDEGLQVLRDHPTLQGVSLIGERFSGDCLPVLGQLPSLMELDTYAIPLSESSVKHLAAWPKLQVLSCDANSPGLAQLGDNQQLGTLQLYRVTDESLRRLPRNSPMKSLWFNISSLTDASLPLLLGFPQLREVGGEIGKISAQGVEQLKAAGIRVNSNSNIGPDANATEEVKEVQGE